MKEEKIGDVLMSHSVSGAKSERIFAIGDVHGCAGKLTTLLERLPLDPKRDTVVFLGDLIDRGPASKEVIERICRLRGSGVAVVGLLGNHEYLLREYQESGEVSLLPYLRANGIEATLASYGAKSQRGLADLSFMPAPHRQFMASLVPYWETDEFIFVHAGIMPGIPLADNDLPTLCEKRGEFLTSEFLLGKRVVFGHTPFATPLLTPTKIGIDTGAVYGNLLTAVELPAVRFYHA
ncbi:MAG: metallophosphoesterase family protein [Desulfobulbaceae bacterium]|nr:metallophosphoesterase family protein [Desulfobulbaceae bacterium]